MNMYYSKKVLKHFNNPKNMGEMKNPDAVGVLGNPLCGDIFKIYLKIGKNKKGEEIVKEIKFQTMGCVAAIATSSVITELAKGKTLKEAKKIISKNVFSSLEGLPPIKIHCSNTVATTLKKAIENWEKKEEIIGS